MSHMFRRLVVVAIVPLVLEARGLDVTPGMQSEIEHAHLYRIPVVSATEVRS